MTNVEYRFLERWRESQVIEKAARRLDLKPASVRMLAEGAKKAAAKAPRLVALPSLDDR